MRPDGFNNEPSSLTITVGRGWRRIVPNLDRSIRRILHVACDGAPLPQSVVLASDAEVKALNYQFRGKNKPTNVLSFPAPDGGADGEIILALGVLRREAKQVGRPMKAHMAHLLVHAVLHLQDYDHYHPSEAREMEMRETVILRRLGFANPWKRGRMPE